MRVTILCVGKIKEKYLQAGIQEYVKRLTPFCKLDIIEVSEEKMPDKPSAAEKQQVLEQEGAKLSRHLRKDTTLVVLDIEGKSLASEQLSETLENWAVSGKSDVTFIIGGAFGLSDTLKKTAALRLSFSKMTFTHQMVRLLLVEQVYRAMKIRAGEPYHW